MMQKTDRDRTLALAGVFQAIDLVESVAHGRRPDPQALEASIGSLFKIDADSVDDVYGGTRMLSTGLARLLRQLGGREISRNTETTRVAVTVLHLERKLSRQVDLMQKIREGIRRALTQTEFFPTAHPNIVAGLADTYLTTVSTLKPRVIVTGEQASLRNPDNANMIRALLLAAIRSAVLWRQCGGSRLRLLLNRAAFQEQCRRLLSWAGGGGTTRVAGPKKAVSCGSSPRRERHRGAPG
jgi:high frequency lysogenization protein